MIAAVDRRPGAAGLLPGRTGRVLPPVADVVERHGAGCLLEDERARNEQLWVRIGLRESRQGAQHRLDLVARKHHFIRGCDGCLVLLGGACAEPLMASFGSNHVVRLVDDDPEQPRPEGGSRAEAVERAVRLHEAVLRRLLRVRVPARDRRRDPVGNALVRLHEIHIRLVIALTGSCDEPSLAFTGG